MFGKVHSARTVLRLVQEGINLLNVFKLENQFLSRKAADDLDSNHPTAAVQCAFAKQIATDYGKTIQLLNLYSCNNCVFCQDHLFVPMLCNFLVPMDYYK